MMIRVLISCLLLAGLATSALAKVKPKNIEVTNQGDNVLRKAISFKLATTGSIHIEWWESEAGEHTKRASATRTASEEYGFVANYLKSGAAYSWRVVETVDGSEDFSKTYRFTTDALPRGLPELSLVPAEQLAQGTPFEGYVLANQAEKPALLYIYDHEANIVWYEMMGTFVRPFRMTDRGTILAIRDKEEVVELNTLGEELWKVKLVGSQPTKLHHDIVEDRNGLFYSLTKTSRAMDLSSVGGAKTDSVHADELVQFDRNGEVRWRWSAFDDADPLKNPFIAKLKFDWGHANGLALDPEDNVVISFRLFDEVWNVDPRHKTVLWKIGRFGTLSLPNSDRFLKQHTPVVDAQGNLLLFDNGEPGERENSRIVKYKPEPWNKRAVELMQVNLPQYLSSEKRASAYPVNERQFLVCSTQAASVFVINAQEAIVWRVNASTPSFRAIPLPKLP